VVFVCAVPGLTPNASIKLNDRVSLLRSLGIPRSRAGLADAAGVPRHAFLPTRGLRIKIRRRPGQRYPKQEHGELVWFRSSQPNKFIFAFFDSKIFTKTAQHLRMPQAAQQRRRLQRRTRHHPSWITFENDVRSYECQILDVSTDGAKLVADIDAPIGTTFRLSAVLQAVVRRRCEVVWRKGRTIGVKFAAEDVAEVSVRKGPTGSRGHPPPRGKV
jgi:hypothetical protein